MFTTVAPAVPKMSIDKIVTDVTGSIAGNRDRQWKDFGQVFGNLQLLKN